MASCVIISVFRACWNERLTELRAPVGELSSQCFRFETRQQPQGCFESNASKAIEDSVHRYFGTCLWSSLYCTVGCGEAHYDIHRKSGDVWLSKLHGLIRWSALEGQRRPEISTLKNEALRCNWVICRPLQSLRQCICWLTPQQRFLL